MRTINEKLGIIIISLLFTISLLCTSVYAQDAIDCGPPVTETSQIQEEKAEELSYDPVYIQRHADSNYIDARNVDMQRYVQPVTTARGIATYNIRKQSEFDVTTSNYIAGLSYEIPVYDVDPNSSYYVAIPSVNRGSKGFTAYDLSVGYNNNKGELIKGWHYKDEICYIPKHLVDDPQNRHGLLSNAILAMQLNYAIGGDMDFSKSIPVEILGKHKPVRRTLFTRNLFDQGSIDVETGIKGRKSGDISVMLNGMLMPINPAVWKYDAASGMLRINACPGIVSNINIVFEPQSNGDALAALGREMVGNLKDRIQGVSYAGSAVKWSSMAFFKTASGNDIKLKYYADRMFTGWRGHYTAKIIYGNSSTHQAQLKAAKGWKNSIHYMYGGYTTRTGTSESSAYYKAMDSTWAISSYTAGTDVIGNAGKIGQTEMVSHEGVKKTIYDWMLKYRDKLEKVTYQPTAGKANGLGGTNSFAFSFPSKVTGASTNLVSSGSNAKRKNQNITFKGTGINTSYYVAASCNHLDAVSASDTSNENEVYVSCLGIGKDYVVLAFVSVQKQRSQNACGIYKFRTDTSKLSIQKSSTDSAASAGMSLKGAKFEVKDKNGHVCGTLTTNDAGKTGAITVFKEDAPFSIKETAAPAGFQIKKEAVTVAGSALTLGETYTVKIADVPDQGWLKIRKKSDDETITADNTCYSLAGAEYAVLDSSGKERALLRTDEKGDSRPVKLAVGNYRVVEKTAAMGYQMDPEEHPVTITAGHTESQPLLLDLVETHKRIPVEYLIHKQDAESGRSLPQGAASLEGACYQVDYYAQMELPNEETQASRTWVFATDQTGSIKLEDAYKRSGEILFPEWDGKGSLPYGWLRIREIEAPKGYLLNPGNAWIDITGDQALKEGIFNVEATEQIATEKPIRGDFTLVKESYPDGHRLSGIPFLLTSLTTGEKHVIVTDAHGEYSSREAAHTFRCNANDAALQENNKLEDSALDSRAGLWFQGYADDGQVTAPDDTVGALPYDDYRLDELSCNANRDLRLIRDYRFTIDQNGKTINLGSLVDYPRMKTQLTGQNGEKRVLEGNDASLKDTVRYQGLINGRKYRLEGSILIREDSALMKGAEDKVLSVCKEFTVHSEDPNRMYVDGEVAMEFQLDTSGLRHKHLVAYEILYEKDEKGEWKEIDRHMEADSKDQTVSVVKPHYTMYKVRTSKAPLKPDTDRYGFRKGQEVLYDVHVINDGDLTLTLQVTDSFQNADLFTPPELIRVEGGNWRNKGADSHMAKLTLKSGEQAVVTFRAIVQTRQESLAANSMDSDSKDRAGKDCNRTEQANQPDDQDGYVNMAKTTEVTYSFGGGGRLKDKEDPSQTPVQKEPEIHTSLVDANGNHILPIGPTVSIQDQIHYDGLVPGQSYRMEGRLMISADKPLSIDGKPVQNSLEFTAAKETGDITLKFEFSGEALTFDRIVAYEKCYSTSDLKTPRASHEDFRDESQTMYRPRISTEMSQEGGGKTVLNLRKVTLVDRVAYHDLIPGKQYEMEGVMMDQTYNEPIMELGKPVKSFVKFKAVSKDGYVDVPFKMDLSKRDGQSLTAFEYCYLDSGNKPGTLVARHQDIKSMSQTVRVSRHVVPAPDTGDSTTIYLYGCLILMALGDLFTLWRTRK